MFLQNDCQMEYLRVISMYGSMNRYKLDNKLGIRILINTGVTILPRFSTSTWFGIPTKLT